MQLVDSVRKGDGAGRDNQEPGEEEEEQRRQDDLLESCATSAPLLCKMLACQHISLLYTWIGMKV